MLFHPHAISIGILSNMTPPPKKKKKVKKRCNSFILSSKTQHENLIKLLGKSDVSQICTESYCNFYSC